MPPVAQSLFWMDYLEPIPLHESLHEFLDNGVFEVVGRDALGGA